jgi:energy-coupling factor transporter ATP-binding protein EcfA2
MKQRVGIARALAMEPKVLLMDEPFGALDALTRAHLQDELLKIVAATKSTVVMVTHDVDEAVLLSDRIVMMTNGPAATIGEIVEVQLERPRDRVALAQDARYIEYRTAVLEFLYRKQAHPKSLLGEADGLPGVFCPELQDAYFGKMDGDSEIVAFADLGERTLKAVAQGSGAGGRAAGGAGAHHYADAGRSSTRSPASTRSRPSRTYARCASSYAWRDHRY